MQKGFAPILIILLVVLAFVFFTNSGIREKINFPQQNTKQESNILNRVYYLSLTNTLNYIDAGSGEKGSVVLQAGLPETSDNLTRTNPSSKIQLTPDKRTLVFVKDNNLWRVDVDGKNLKQLTTDGILYDKPECPVKIDKFFISSDSKNIYYLLISDYYNKGGMNRKADGTTCTPTLKNDRQESAVDLNGVKQKFIEPEDRRGKVIGWVPDNKSLYYSYTGGYSGPDNHSDESKLIKQDIQTGTSTELVKGGVYGIDSILWDKDATRGVSTGYGFLNLIDANFKILGTYPTKVGVPDGQAMLNTEYNYYDWKAGPISPNGKSVVLIEIPQIHFAKGDSGWKNNILAQKSNVYLWDTETKKETKLPITVDSDSTIRWRENSSQLIYHVVRRKVDPGNETQDSDALYVYDLQSKKETLLIDFYNDLRGAYEYVLY